MKKVAIVYICTGPYIAFWEGFFRSFEENFLNSSEVHYFVFTDSADIAQSAHARVHVIATAHQPWPLVTLLRFHILLQAEDELDAFDYIYFINSNMKCSTTVSEEEFLPRKEKNEQLVFTEHPGYLGVSAYRCPFERNPASSAYVPYNAQGTYVIGALHGGEADAYLAMAHKLKDRVDCDLKNRLIALWHDESQVNRYVLERSGTYRLLTPAFMYPPGWDIPYEHKLDVMLKTTVFDIDSFRESDKTENNSHRFRFSRVRRRLGRYCSYVLPRVLSLRDALLHRSIGN